MKYRSPESAAKPPVAPGRRGLLLGSGVVAAAGVAAAVGARALQSAAPEAVAAKPKDDTQDGYRLSQHVLRYYETTRV